MTQEIRCPKCRCVIYYKMPFCNIFKCWFCGKIYRLKKSK